MMRKGFVLALVASSVLGLGSVATAADFCFDTFAFFHRRNIHGQYRLWAVPDKMMLMGDVGASRMGGRSAQCSVFRVGRRVLDRSYEPKRAYGADKADGCDEGDWFTKRGGRGGR